jgi:uncharacterized protein
MMIDAESAVGSPPASPVIGPRVYVQALRDQLTLWRALVAMVAGLGALGLIFLTLLPIGDFIDGVFGRKSLSSSVPDFTISLWLAGNLGLAALIAVSIGLERLLYGRTAPRLHSITGRFRWRLVGHLALVLTPVWVMFSGALLLLLQRPVVITDYTIPCLLLVLTTVPLQAAGEEYLYRGLISRAVGSQFANPRTAIVAAMTISGLLFVLSHGNADPWTNAFYVSAVIGLSLTAHVSQGLEAPALIHALINVSFFLPLVLTNSLDKFGAPQAPSVVLLAIGLVLTMPLLVGFVLRRAAGATAPNGANVEPESIPTGF